MDRRNVIAWGLAAVAAITGSGCTETVDRVERGDELYTYCEQCHGVDGQGNQAFGAPAIAGLEDWYVEAQLNKFRIGARGDHPDDAEGLRMRPMSRTLASAAEIRIVAEHVAAMEPVNAPATIEGASVDRGQTLYAPCVQCHGAHAEGNREKGAPSLTGASDWYLVRQLGKFRSGVRGSDPLDTSGSQMRAMVSTLTDEQAMRDVVAYVTSLD